MWEYRKTLLAATPFQLKLFADPITEEFVSVEQSTVLLSEIDTSCFQYRMPHVFQAFITNVG